MTATIDRDERESSSREDTLTDVRISGDQDLAAADATLAFNAALAVRLRTGQAGTRVAGGRIDL